MNETNELSKIDASCSVAQVTEALNKIFYQQSSEISISKLSYSLLFAGLVVVCQTIESSASRKRGI